MKTLVVYDSVYGNTEIIAQAIGAALPGEVKVLRVGQVTPSEVEGLVLLVVGSPTYGGKPTQAVQSFLDRLPVPAPAGTQVATFDTRFSTRWVRIFGYAAPRIAHGLQEKGWSAVGSPAGFFVKGTKGPLQEGEEERAAHWAEALAGTMAQLD
jgi:flavodoxin